MLNEKWLEPEQIKGNLIQASLYLTSFELLKDSIVNGVRNFYVLDCGNGICVGSSEYKADVLSKHKYQFEASLMWLCDASVITLADSDRIQKIREHRNKIVHELPSLLLGQEFTLDVKMLEEIRHYLRVIDRFWGTISVDTDPAFDGREVDYEEIVSLRTLLLEHIAKIVDAELVSEA